MIWIGAIRCKEILSLRLIMGKESASKLVEVQLNVVNIYISQFPPVDDYEFRLTEPLCVSGRK